MTTRPLVLKLGGELLETRERRATIVQTIREIAPRAPLVVVHGGGKEIDAALKTAGLEKRQVDGLRITDEATLEVVVAVLAGTVNTQFVAVLNSGDGVQAVGLTGADAKVGLVRAAAPHQSVDGQVVDLGRVGVPADDAPKRLLDALLIEGFVPVVACIGVDDRGELFNVNADILAAHLAARLSARRLVIAGTTAGVLDAGGRTLPLLDTAAIERLVRERTATAGMIAKLRACEHALSAVEDVVIVDGRDASALVSAATPGNVTLGSATRLVRMVTA